MADDFAKDLFLQEVLEIGQMLRAEGPSMETSGSHARLGADVPAVQCGEYLLAVSPEGAGALVLLLGVGLLADLGGLAIGFLTDALSARILVGRLLGHATGPVSGLWKTLGRWWSLGTAFLALVVTIAGGCGIWIAMGFVAQALLSLLVTMPDAVGWGIVFGPAVLYAAWVFLVYGFAAQVAAVEGRSGFGALRRSRALVLRAPGLVLSYRLPLLVGTACVVMIVKALSPLVAVALASLAGESASSWAWLADPATVKTVAHGVGVLLAMPLAVFPSAALVPLYLELRRRLDGGATIAKPPSLQALGGPRPVIRSIVELLPRSSVRTTVPRTVAQTSLARLFAPEGSRRRRRGD